MAGGFASQADGTTPVTPGGGFASQVVTPDAAPIAPQPTGKTVNVVSPDGKVYGLDAAYLPDAAKQGYQIESAEQAGIRRYLEENKGLGGAAKVALRGMLDEATFGAGDVLVDSTQDPYELAKFRALRDASPVANYGGRAAGFALSMLYGGEFFQGANAAGKAARAGVLAERALAKGLAAEAAYRIGAEGAEQVAKHAPGIARQALAAAADYGAQGMVFAAPKAAAQLLTGDPDKAAETWIWGAAGGAALGGVVGALGGVAGKIKGFSALSSATKATALADEVTAAERAVAEAEAAHGVAPDITEGVPDAVKAARDNLAGIKGKLESVRATMADHVAKLPEYAEAWAQYATGKPEASLRDIAKDFAEEQAVRAINPYKKYADKLADMPGGDRAAGRLLLDKGLLPKTNEQVAEYAGRLGEKVDELGGQIGAYHDALDAAGDVISLRAIARNMRTGVLDPLKKKVGYQAQAAKVERYIADFEEKHGLARLEGETKKQWLARTKDIKASVKELHAERLDFDRLLYGENSALTADKVDKEYRAIRQMYGMALDNGYQSAGKALGMTAEQIGAIKQLNREFGAFKTIHSAVEANIGREISNRGFGSMTDMLAGIAGSAGGALLGPIGGAAGGLLASYVNNQLRKNANHWLAELADTYARTGHVPDVVSRAKAQLTEAFMPGKWADATDRVAGAAGGALRAAGAKAEEVFGDAAGRVAAKAAAPFDAAAAKIAGAADVNAASAASVQDAAAKIADAASRIEAAQTQSFGNRALAALEAAFAKHDRELSRVPAVLDHMAGRKSPARETLGVNVLSRFLGMEDRTKLDKPDDVMAFADRMAALASNPDDMEARSKAAIAPLSADAPEVAMAVAAKLPQVAQYLASQAPQSPYSVPVPFTPAPTWKPTDAQVKDYRTKVAVALDPYKALDALADGTLTKAHVDALQAVAPKLYQEMLKRINDYGSSGKAPSLPYAQRLKLSMMTGAPLDRSLAQLSNLQGIYQTKDASKVDGGGRPLGKSNPALQTTDIARLSG